MTDQATEQMSPNSPSTATVEAGATFIDPASEPDRYIPEREHTLEDELAELGRAFPKVAELLRTAIKYLA